MDDRERGRRGQPAPSRIDPVTLALFIVAGACLVGYFAYDILIRKPREAVQETAQAVKSAIEPLAKTAGEAVKDITKAGKDAVEDGTKKDGVVGGLIDKIKQTAKDVDPKDVVRSGTEIGHDMTRAGADMADQFIGLTLDEEWSWGDRIRDDLVSQLAVSDDQDALARIHKVAQPVLNQLRRTKGREYTFTVVEDEVMNAFATLGGNIFVYRGLLNEMTSDEALQGVIAHEIAHVELAHCVKASAPALRTQEVTGQLGGVLVSQIGSLIVRGYSEQQEFEADLFAYNAMKKIGLPKSDRLQFAKQLRDFAAKADIHDDLDSKADSLGGQIGKEFRKHFRSHPPSPERLRRLEQLPE